MKLLDLRKQLKTTFETQGIEVEDVDIIISEVLNVPRTELVLIDSVEDDVVKTIIEKATERLNNVPVDKIFNKAYFYGLEFKVDENVLTPRADSEVLVETALKYIKQNNYKECLDLCTGSGCLAISVKKNADVNVLATDISSKALQIAKFNAQANDVDVKFLRSNMFEKIEGKFDLIISNPPYIDSDEIKLLDAEVKEHDPHLALDGGAYGLKFYNIIHDNLRKYLNENGMCILEIGEDQKDLVTSLFNDFELVETVLDYAGIERVLVFKR